MCCSLSHRSEEPSTDERRAPVECGLGADNTPLSLLTPRLHPTSSVIVHVLILKREIFEVLWVLRNSKVRYV